VVSVSSTARSSGGRASTVALIVLLLALAAIPLTAVWLAFQPAGNDAPDFTLTDQNGNPFKLSEQGGHLVVLFFGYTHCPDVCPATLARLARAVHAPGVYPDVLVVFITVDPERDSPPVLKRYMRLFDPDFIGLTGSLAELNPVYSAYHTWRQAVPVNHGKNDYSMAHGTTIYYIGRGGSLRGVGNWDESTASIVRDLEKFG
jgi:protein SCO1/2